MHPFIFFQLLFKILLTVLHFFIFINYVVRHSYVCIYFVLIFTIEPVYLIRLLIRLFSLFDLFWLSMHLYSIFSISPLGFLFSVILRLRPKSLVVLFCLLCILGSWVDLDCLDFWKSKYFWRCEWSESWSLNFLLISFFMMFLMMAFSVSTCLSFWLVDWNSASCDAECDLLK